MWATTDKVETSRGRDSSGFSKAHLSRDSTASISLDKKLPCTTSGLDDLPPIYDDEPETDAAPDIRDSGALKLAVEGQGLVAVKVTPRTQFSITSTPSPDISGEETALRLELTETSAKFFAISLKATTDIPTIAPQGTKAALLTPGVNDLYWKSTSATCLEANLDIGDKTTKAGPFIWVKSISQSLR